MINHVSQHLVIKTILCYVGYCIKCSLFILVSAPRQNKVRCTETEDKSPQLAEWSWSNQLASLRFHFIFEKWRRWNRKFLKFLAFFKYYNYKLGRFVSITLYKVKIRLKINKITKIIKPTDTLSTKQETLNK